MKAAACRAACSALLKTCSPRRVVGEDFRSSEFRYNRISSPTADEPSSAKRQITYFAVTPYSKG
jgi:hypothetical protein